MSLSSVAMTRLFMAKKKKMSMAEKRRKRAKSTARVQNNPFPFRPPAIDTKDPSVNTPEETSSAPVTSSNKAFAGKETVVTKNQATNKAQELLRAQRESVGMLTTVKECIEGLPAAEILVDLDEKGYWYGDLLLKKREPDLFGNLAEEGKTLQPSMQVDMDRLGMGEYICPLTGGDQYNISPRAIEWVVSTTKHLPGLLDESLDAANCMAQMRTFDRKAWQASTKLLTGSSVEELEGNENQSAPEVSFRQVVNPDATEEDLRRLSLHYYLVSEDWGKELGGGLTFQKTGETIDARQDRLVIWRSDQTVYRPDAWSGSDDLALGSCIEMHLVQAKSS